MFEWGDSGGRLLSDDLCNGYVNEIISIFRIERRRALKLRPCLVPFPKPQSRYAEVIMHFGQFRKRILLAGFARAFEQTGKRRVRPAGVAARQMAYPRSETSLGPVRAIRRHTRIPHQRGITIAPLEINLPEF